MLRSLLGNSEYNIIQEICHNVCPDPGLVQDLVQEVCLIWLEMDAKKREGILQSNAFRWWVARVVKTQWSSSSSPFYTKYRKHKHLDLLEVALPDDPYDVTEDLKWAQLQKHIRTLYPSEYNIFRSYYIEGLTIMQVTAKYGVDKNFVWATLKRVRESIQRRIDWESETPNPVALSETLAPYVGRKRLKAEERQMVIDVHWALNSSGYNNIHDRETVNRILKNLVIMLGL